MSASNRAAAHSALPSLISLDFLSATDFEEGFLADIDLSSFVMVVIVMVENEGNSPKSLVQSRVNLGTTCYRSNNGYCNGWVAGFAKLRTQIEFNLPRTGNMATRPEERNQDATVYVGNVDDRVSEGLLWELMLQAGPVVNVHLPKDRVTQQHQGYGFVEYMTEEDADYAIKIMNMIKLFGKPIRVNKATSDKKNLDVGASLFIGNLDADVDEKLLYDTFSAFGVIVQTPNVARDPDTGNSRGYGFVAFDNFESSDAAIEAMNGQFLMNKEITVSYAYKKDGKGERHGSSAERLLAQQARRNQPAQLPNRFFADIPTRPGGGMAPAPPAPLSMPPAPPMFMGGPPQPPQFPGYPPGPPPGSYGGPPQPPMGMPPPMPMHHQQGPPPFPTHPPMPPPPFPGQGGFPPQGFPPHFPPPPPQWGAGR